MSFDTQERITVKITYAPGREPEYHHWAADNLVHPEGGKAMAFYKQTLRDRSLEVTKVEIYLERHAYTMRLYDRWERESGGNGDGTDDAEKAEG